MLVSVLKHVSIHYSSLLRPGRILHLPKQGAEWESDVLASAHSYCWNRTLWTLLSANRTAPGDVLSMVKLGEANRAVAVEILAVAVYGRVFAGCIDGEKKRGMGKNGQNKP